MLWTLALVTTVSAQPLSEPVCPERQFYPPMARATVVEAIIGGVPLPLLPPVEGRVVHVRGNTVTVSFGTDAALAPGDSVLIGGTPQELRHPRTGELLGMTDRTTGSVRIERVSSAAAIGRLAAGHDIRVGDRATFRPTAVTAALTVVSLVEATADASAETAVRGLVDDLAAAGRLQLTTDGALGAALKRAGVAAADVWMGNGVEPVARQSKVENLLVVRARVYDGVPYTEARLMEFPAYARSWPINFRRRCTPITGDALSQARFDAGSHACHRGEAAGCRELGALYEESSTRVYGWRRLELAAEFYRLACDGGDAEACRDLGAMYQLGRGVAKGPGRAAALYRRACELADLVACGP